MKARSLFALAALSLIYTGCKVQTASTAPGPETATQKVETAQATTAKAERRDLVGYRLLGGTLSVPTRAQANVYSTGTAPVQNIYVTVGDHVAKGQTILSLGTGQDTTYAQAKATYDAALSAYNQALAQYELPVKEASRKLDDARAAEKAARQSTVPGGDATALQAAKADRQSAQDALDAARAQARSNELSYKQQLDQAKVALTQAIESRTAAKATAPISGTVLAITANPGQQPTPQTPLATIVDLGALEVKADVSPEDASTVKPGTPVVILFNDFPNKKFTGRVRSVDTLPSPEGGKVRYQANIDFKNDGSIKPKMSVHAVGIEMGKVTGVVAVPVDAVAKDATGRPVVKVLENGTWKPVVVELGMSDGFFVEIKSGVEAGDTVQVVPNQGQWMFGVAPATAHQ